MRAVVVSEFGEPEQLVLAEVDDPIPGPGQVRIAVRMAGTNPVDAGNRTDGTWAGLSVPFVPGYDVAGTIESVGEDVEHVAVGDRVMAMTPFPRGGGGYAELVVVAAVAVAPIPDMVSFQQAAATPLAAGTALTVLDRLACRPGSWLLVLGASGGVGLFLVQLAAAQGIKTIGVGRQAMHEQMLSLGAVGCIDYTCEDIAERALTIAGGQVDAIADLVGGPTLSKVSTCLCPDGAIAAIATPDLDLDRVLDANWTFHGVLIRDDGRLLKRLAELLGDGSLRPVVSQVIPLADAARAHHLLQTGPTRGKIVLSVVEQEQLGER